MGWTWLKQLFFSSAEENNLETDCDGRVIEEGQQYCQEDSDVKEIGVVTSLHNGLVEINKNLIAKEDLVLLKIGAIVTYCKPENPESNLVFNVELVQNVKKRTNLENIINEGIISYVDEEKVLINPGSLVIWRCDSEISFSPQPNDYAKLEFYNDILKVHPRECKIMTDEVISWNGMHGFLKSNVRISQDVCENFYVPKVGDIVIGSAIPCIGDGYQWRCLILSKFDKNLGQHKRIEVKNIPTFILPIGTEKIIEVPVKNISLKSLEIKRVQIIPHLTNVTLLQNSIRQIEPGINVTYRILCCGRVLGRTVFTLEFKFRSFVFHRNVKFLTVEEGVEERSDQNNTSKGSLLLINQPFNKKPLFLKHKPKTYEIPSYLLEISGKSVLESMSLIQEKLPELCKGLTEETYAIYFHTVLFLEELSRIQLMEQMETVAPLIKRGQYYVFSFEEETIYHNLSPGDTVLLSNPWEEDESESPAVVKIWMRKDNEIFFNFKDVFNIIGSSGALFRMKFKNNRTSTVRTHHAIDFFLNRISVQWLFPDVSFVKIYDEDKLKTQINFFNKELNEEQKDAVRNIVLSNNNCSSPYLLFGPPGTGKTVTLVETVSQIILHYPDSRILIAAPSNSATDTFCELLISNGLLSNKALLRLISFTYSQQGQMPVCLVEYSAILGTNISQEDSEIRFCDPDAITHYKVVASTLSNLGILNCLEIRRGHFTHIFVDEAGQTTEPETLIPLAGIQPGSSRVVLAGDPKQLGPVIFNPVAKEYGLGDSLMLRLMELPFYSRCLEAQNGPFISKVATRLCKNYRSLPCLVNLFSNLFYNDQLVAMLSEDSEETQLLNKIKNVRFISSASSLVVVNVKGQEVASICERNSFGNLMEAARVSLIVIELYNAGFTSTQIGVITPYSLQVKNIRQCFSTLQVEPPKVGTVEEFQGSERDIIVLSLVRTTLDTCHLSFIGDARRSNVALSRAKVMNIVVGNEATLRRSNLWGQVLNRAVTVD